MTLVSKRRLQQKAAPKAGATTVALANGGFTTSVYAMTPAQGLELGGGGSRDEYKFATGTTSYFSQSTGFGKVKDTK